ncbi:hypothetical protein EWM62_05110 [Mucilaginibacter terrigena]|uniref:Tetratricopeptide repeat protein n=1 Tax=Mucilaginibacter terrigena TaxID=2492395 RepID=A0A4Q5LPI9_9SPHI|nr:DUF6624 domain-containing protein [Mucilaginibacter terrigena]RYU91321.1 hypothetical protein EWM62_05110 [Mucilaginibacter terrigena]
MRTVIAIIAVNLMLFRTALAQNTGGYPDSIKKAFALYEAKNYRASAQTYTNAFKVNGWKGFSDDRYNAACSWALAGNADSAFYQLDRVVNLMAYNNYAHITTDTDLNSLHNNKRWATLIATVAKNKEKAEEKLNKPLVRELETIYADDQSGRKKIDSLAKIYGLQSPQVKELFKTIALQDSVNLMKVKKILDKHGWAGPDEVGALGTVTLFLVIQHADLATQKQYLPLMREAVKSKKLRASSLAMLEDRINVREGKKQLYGSQLRSDAEGKMKFDPIEDEPNVDKRRAEVGLEPLKDYAKRFGLDYTVPEQ